MNYENWRQHRTKVRVSASYSNDLVTVGVRQDIPLVMPFFSTISSMLNLTSVGVIRKGKPVQYPVLPMSSYAVMEDHASHYLQ